MNISLKEILEISQRKGEPVWVFFKSPDFSQLLIASWAPESIRELNYRLTDSLMESELELIKGWLLSLPDVDQLEPDEALAETTRTGRPAVWEQGGGFTRTGWATVWCAPDGSPLQPLYVRRKGERACKEHALLPATIGIFKISAVRSGLVEISKIVQLRQGYFILPTRRDWAVKLRLVYQGPADGAPEFLTAAVKAAVEKASCYHCRTPHYINET